MMRRTVLLLVLAGVLCLGACGGDEDAVDTSAVSPSAQRGDAIVIRTRKKVALTEGAEPIATGKVMEGSTLGDSPFCVGGTVVDSHGSNDPTVWLIIETITCPDGTLKLRLEPDRSPGLTQTGSWTVESGGGSFEDLRGGGEMEAVYDPDPAEPAHATFTGISRVGH
ncbi:MAG: hypothetical protein ACXW0F_13340 [Gaiellaceae bacterium]